MCYWFRQASINVGILCFTSTSCLFADLRVSSLCSPMAEIRLHATRRCRVPHPCTSWVQHRPVSLKYVTSSCSLGATTRPMRPKLSMRTGAWAWVHVEWTCGAKVLEYWMIFSLKIKLNRNWTFWRNWNVPLELLERYW
jgi:hypothetical protein